MKLFLKFIFCFKIIFNDSIKYTIFKMYLPIYSVHNQYCTSVISIYMAKCLKIAVASVAINQTHRKIQFQSSDTEIIIKHYKI